MRLLYILLLLLLFIHTKVFAGTQIGFNVGNSGYSIQAGFINKYTYISIDYFIHKNNKKYSNTTFSPAALGKVGFNVFHYKNIHAYISIGGILYKSSAVSFLLKNKTVKNVERIENNLLEYSCNDLIKVNHMSSANALTYLLNTYNNYSLRVNNDLAEYLTKMYVKFDWENNNTNNSCNRISYSEINEYESNNTKTYNISYSASSNIVYEITNNISIGYQIASYKLMENINISHMFQIMYTF